MIDYEIQRCTRRCAATDRELKDGETCYSVLVAEGAAVVRRDYSAQAWQGPPDQVVSSPYIFLLLLIGSIGPALLLRKPYDKFCGVVTRRLGAFWVPAATLAPASVESCSVRPPASDSARTARLTGEIV